MAQYLPYINPVSPEPVLYQPDWGMIGNALQKKDYQFQQGIGQARQAYNSVLNAPLSDPSNVAVRDQYVKDAKEKLKNLASADFSLPENVQAAENVFSPFWQDQFILKDQATTTWYQTQQQKLAGWRDSTDPKVRGMYSPILEQYLNNGLYKLQSAGRNPEQYAKVQRREAVPFTNIQDYLQDMAGKEKDKLEIKWDSPEGPYLVSAINGEKSLKKFSTWAQGMLSNNFDEQFKITGQVEAENIENSIRHSNPNLSDAQVHGLVADHVVSTLDRGRKQRLNDIDAQVSEITNSLKTYPETIGDPQQQERFNQLIKDREELNNLKSTVTKEYDDFNKAGGDKEKIKQNFVNNPSATAGYYSTLAKQAAINNWAAARSSVQGQEIKQNEAYFKIKDLEFKQQQETDKVNYQNKFLELKSKGKLSKDATLTYDSQGNPIIGGSGLEGEDVTTGGHFIGLGQNILQTKDAAEVYNNHNAFLNSVGHDQIFGTNGTLGVTKNLGLDDEDIMQLSSGLKRQLQQGEDFQWRPEEIKALDKLSKADSFKDYWKDTKADNVREGLLSYTKKYFNDKLTNKIDLSAEDYGIIKSYYIGNAAFEELNANESKRKELVKSFIQADPKTYGTITIDRNGKKDLIQVDDLAKDMPTLELIPYDHDNKDLKLSKKDVARLFMNGKLSTTNQGEIFVGDVKYGVSKTNNDDGSFSATRTYNTIYKEIAKKYGESADFAALMNKANNAVIPNLPFYQSQTGKLGTVWHYDLDDVKKDPQSFVLMEEALLPNNQTNMYTIDVDGKSKVIDDMKTRNAITMALNNREDLKKYVKGFDYSTQGINGRPTITFNIGALKSNDKEEVGGKKLTDLNTERIAIEISPDAKGTYLNNLPQNTGMYIYDKLLRGESIKSDDMVNSFGINYSIVPNNSTNPTGGVIEMKYILTTPVKNPSTGIIELKKEPKTQREVFSFNGDNAKTPDEVVMTVNNLASEVLMYNQNNTKQYNTISRTNGTAINRDDVLRAKGIIK
jgi:hypothetical protein